MTVQNQPSKTESPKALPYSSMSAAKLPNASQDQIATGAQQQPVININDESEDTDTYSNTDTKSNAAANSVTAGNQNSSPSAVNEQPNDHSNIEYRALNVKDALSYLEKVKKQFLDRPTVYNQFLDIMKDFKSQVVDTPGVIKRVSSLFKDYPNLVFGFNTFLPAGYRVEYSTDPHDPNGVKVVTPDDPSSQESAHHKNDFYTSQTYPTGSSSSKMIPSLQNTHMSHDSSAAIPQTHISAFHSNAQHASSRTDKGVHLEFDQAVDFVNRIKSRYINAPDIYSQFLNLLQLYQQQEMEASDVYTHFCRLFQDDDDFIEEFKQFIPELHSSIGEKRKSPHSNSNMLPSQPKRRMTNSRRKSKPEENDDTSTSDDRRVSELMNNKGKKRKSPHNTPEMLSKQPKRRLTNSKPKPKQNDNSTGGSDNQPVSTTELEFFDRVKSFLGNRPSYEEFLKTLNLYSQQILTMQALVDQVATFFGNNVELLDTFKAMLGYESAPPPPSSEITPKPDLNKCAKIEASPSYRQVSKDWQILPCSGRDELCWEVLNDTYVSHPVRGAEENNFSATKRNIPEENLYRCEEERYEYDLNIEANLSVITLLKPIADKIEKMTPEEQDSFTLEPGLGGDSVAIYTRIIKQVYGKERGTQIIEMLYTSPANVIPTVLKRLQIKDNEWRQGRLDQNNKWQEEEFKSFYRSLDYQSASFKEQDRKSLNPKALQQEAEKTGLQEAEFAFGHIDHNISKDISQLVTAYIDKQSSAFTKSDASKIKKYIDSFASLLLPDDQADKEVSSVQVSDAAKQPTINTGDAEDGPAKDDDDKDSELSSCLTAISKDHNTKTTTLKCKIEHYPLFRLYQTIYNRLLNFKSSNDQLEAHFNNGLKQNKIAVDLGLIDSSFEGIDLSRGHYAAMMEVAIKFLDGNLDQQRQNYIPFA